jgi:hypothetical protein
MRSSDVFIADSASLHGSDVFDQRQATNEQRVRIGKWIEIFIRRYLDLGQISKNLSSDHDTCADVLYATPPRPYS